MDDVDGINEGLAAALYAEYLDSPARVPAAWRELFAGRTNGHRARPTEPDDVLLGALGEATELVRAIRTQGHLAARLDPLGAEPPLDAGRFTPTTTRDVRARIPASLLRVGVRAVTVADALPRLREAYCGTTAYEIEHVPSDAERLWLREAVESGRYRRPLTSSERRQLLERLSRVESFERYLRRAFLGQKQFSLEGLDVLVPLLDAAIELAAHAGAREVVLGMAHRGRLDVLANVCDRPYEEILRGFERHRATGSPAAEHETGAGDVKYHLGASAIRRTSSGEIAITLLPNPSHLEAVGPVVAGYARAKQTDRASGSGHREAAAVLPLVVHGDAAFAAQGVVGETLNLRLLEGYATGGTLHVIANNQVGFTTDPGDGRSTHQPSDLAKGFGVPVVHVNADDPEAALSAVRLALAYRREFRRDVVIDLVGYRRVGHNEQDEGSYTQPIASRRIESHPTVRELYARRLAAEGIVTPAEAEGLVESVTEELRSAHAAPATSRPERAEGETPAERDPETLTAVPTARLRALVEGLVRMPPGFVVNPKLVSQLGRRREALDGGAVDWAYAEALAFASLLAEGVPVRLTGQDVERGTFSQRHLVLHDFVSGERHTPLHGLSEADASFEVHNSPLSEYAALAFEHGYAVAAPEALVVWEAQFGDFVNGAQIVLDQFVHAGRSKWGQTSRLTLLLPHGYEGNGPEHSSARVERFLQSAAEENIRVAVPSAAAQYFHLLRRQALQTEPRPLIVMTPKGLLRAREASTRLADLAEGSFLPVLDDEHADCERVKRLVLCTGRLFYDIAADEHRPCADRVAVARVEELYPFPERAVAELVAGYPSLQELVWAQEEPVNMGAFASIRQCLEQVLPEGVALRYVGRPRRASPSEGSASAHGVEQRRIVREALRELLSTSRHPAVHGGTLRPHRSPAAPHRATRCVPRGRGRLDSTSS